MEQNPQSDEKQIEFGEGLVLVELEAQAVLDTCATPGWKIITRKLLRNFENEAIEMLDTFRRENTDDMLVAIGERGVVKMLKELPSEMAAAIKAAQSVDVSGNEYHKGL